MDQIGYSVIDIKTGTELKFYGDTVGQCVGIPDVIEWPNGDRTHCASVGMEYMGCKFVYRYFSPIEVEAKDTISFDGEKIIVSRYIPKVRRLVDKYIIVDRLQSAGKLEDAYAALNKSDLYTQQRWNTRSSIYSDDETALALLKSIGVVPAVILA